MKLISLISVLFLALNTYGQNRLSEEIIQTLDLMDVVYIGPIDSKYSLELPNKKNTNKELVDYDFKIKQKDKLVMIKLIKETDKSFIKYPHLEFQRLLTHVSSNQDESYIYVYNIPRDKEVDWMSEARFTPKKQITDYEFGTAKVYYTEGKGMIVVLYFDKKFQTSFEQYVGFKEDEHSIK